LKIPPQACDCHVHVFGPAARFPFAPKRLYTPPDASVEELLALQKRLGFERVVIVHPSPYGSDNACTLDALKKLGERARGVAVIDKGTSKKELLEMQKLGVRGVRVNLETSGVHEPVAAQRLLEEAAERVAALGWHVQTFTKVSVLEALRHAIENLPVPLVIDHFGLPRDRHDCEYLIGLLKTENVYVKLSAPHRVPIDPGPAARALIAANPQRCLWGTDWPHPFTRGPRRPQEVQPFDPIDDLAALERFHAWVGDAALFRKILVDNPARLYDFQQK
jgi:predicted TIM-barrel fold metal-dependent hydrolase